MLNATRQCLNSLTKRCVREYFHLCSILTSNNEALVLLSKLQMIPSTHQGWLQSSMQFSTTITQVPNIGSTTDEILNSTMFCPFAAHRNIFRIAPRTNPPLSAGSMQNWRATEKEIKHTWEPNANKTWTLRGHDGSRIRTSSPTEERRYSPSSGPPNPPPLPSPPAFSKPPSSNPSSGSFPKKSYCPASKFSAARNGRSSQNRKGTIFSTQITSDNHELNDSSKQIDFFSSFLNPEASRE